VGVAGKIRLVHHRGKFFAGELLIDFLNLRGEAIIRASPALADEACNLRIGFQRCANRFDPSLCFLGRAVGQSGADLFPKGFEECMLVVQDCCNGTRTVTWAGYFRAEFASRIECRYPLAHVSPVTHVVLTSSPP